jgi:hypothetical protein
MDILYAIKISYLWNDETRTQSNDTFAESINLIFNILIKAAKVDTD